MDQLSIRANGVTQDFRLTLRDAVAPVFRQRRLASTIFIGIFSGAMLAAVLMPRKYEAEMKILVNRDRIDPAVSPNPDSRVVTGQAASITEEDLNSEVELLKSRDLLEEVVVACGLESRNDELWGRIARWSGAFGGPGPAHKRRLARAVRALDSRLIIDPLKKTSVIRVTYSSVNPELAARVLQTLATLYQQKHAAVHRPAGTFSFFDLETERYRKELAAHEAQLESFTRQSGLVDPSIQKQLVLQQLGEFQTELDQDRAGMDAALKRVLELKTQQSISPARQTTVVRKGDNAELLAQLNSTLLSLELKRSEMRVKYAPDYPLIQELDAQIADARKSLADAQRSPVEETTTDRTPAQDWIATELAKAETERAALEAKTGATERAVREYKALAQQIDRKSMTQGDLMRDVKTSEDSYLLYLRKREEARISDLLDQKRIVNVSIAEAATVPAFPSLNLGWLIAAGFFGASGISLGAAYAADRMTPLFRSPEEVSRYLDLKVLAAIPTLTQ